MQVYLDLLKDVMENGVVRRNNRTGIDTKSVFGRQIRMPLENPFPIITTKKILFESVLVELLWFLEGTPNPKFMIDNKVTIWDEWITEDGILPYAYGEMWRNWPTATDEKIDQIARVIESLKSDPFSRRHVVSAWNAEFAGKTALDWCHVMFQFYVDNRNKLSCHMTQRSADIFLGVPFNISSYAVLTHIIAKICGFGLGELIISFGDLHAYETHYDAIERQLKRTPNFAASLSDDCVEKSRILPTLHISDRVKSVDGLLLSDFSLKNYFPLGTIKAPVAV